MEPEVLASDDVAQLARQLVADAGMDAAVSNVVRAKGTNANAIVILASGQRFVYRRYSTSGEGTYAPAARMRREAWLFEQLGTPVVLARSDDPPALLLEFVPGETLGDLAARGEATEDQWRRTGAAFRALHRITATDAADAGIDVERDDARGDLASVAEWLDAVATSRADIDLAPARELHARASSSPRRSALIHGDAHMWNVLAGNRCVLIDLEKSRGGDPDFDLAYFDGLRFAKDIGPVPDAFYDGYGSRPSGTWYELHRVEIAATIVDLAARRSPRLAWALPGAERVLATAGRG